MKTIKMGVPTFLIIFSIVFLIASLNLPKANLGNPNAPIYFPAGLSIIMLIFSVIYFFQELKNFHKENEYIKQILSGRTPKLIGFTLLFGGIYALIFDRIGFLFSTIIYLGALLFYINGLKKWLVNIIVTISFSFISWYAFSVLLGVSLP
ncbi:tripartite tricarboxylate transporter TctB family protein [Halobacillus shinanisalinarum]|uniref:Tripartite tricarboxylate transporter TctB family protein n=1 Tax=Halobacillus shinanisalinarum TaxID=2932258 RepID=A0ABY4GW56_9BACI|nr:tripartite tricarboxylate transporter TctB family protein [Halobacillus shinanisalinarum]UOQ92395.1 tripartite tricarboxylate transporter TctB family protein [Halobacillus shinanisalinarum]